LAFTYGDESVKLAAAQGERDAFFVLGLCFCNDEGLDENLDIDGQKLFCLQASLVTLLQGVGLGDLLDASDPQKWRWWGRAAALEKRGAACFYSVLRNKLSCSSPVVLVSCLPLEEVCTDMRMRRREGFSISSTILILASAHRMQT
jgi:hypothetical protein